MRIEDKNEAVEVFEDMLDSNCGKETYMYHFLDDHDEFYHFIPDEMREFLGLGFGTYYTEY